MDNTMVKRGIGAVVLAIIAALLLGYLLKDKSRERQDVVKMSLPGTTTEGKIPSLSDTAENAGTVISDGGESIAAAGSSATETGSKVVAAATGTAMVAAGVMANSASAAHEGAANKTNQIASNTNNNRPGFSIRPAAKNEQREIVDLNGRVAPNQPAGSKAKKTRTSSHNASNRSNGSVVANATGKAPESTYKPRLIKERKRAKIVSSAKGSTKTNHAQAMATRAHKTPTRTAKKNVAVASKDRKGYAIQLLATSSQSRASKLRNTMKSEGYNSYITRTKKSNNKVLYRVRIGVKGNRNTAISFQQKMKRRYRKNYNVQNSLVVSN